MAFWLAAYYYRVNYFVLVVLAFVVAFVRHPLAFVAIGGAVFTTLCLNDSFSHTIRRAGVARCHAHRSADAAPPNSERVVRTARRLHPPLASKLRNPSATCVLSPRDATAACVLAHASHRTARSNAPAGRPYARSKTVYMCGQDRRLVVGAMYAVSGASALPLLVSLPFSFFFLALTLRTPGLLMYTTGALRTVFGTLALSLGLCLLHATFRSPNLKARLNVVNEEFRAVWRGYNDL